MTSYRVARTVSKVEKALAKREYALGVFLFIQGAFDNGKPQAVIQGMEAKGISKETQKWYDHYL